MSGAVHDPHAVTLPAPPSVPPSNGPATAQKYPFQAGELHAVMTECGCSESNLADHLGISRATVRQFLAGTKPLAQDWIERFPVGMRIRWAQRALMRAEEVRDGRIPVQPVEKHIRRGLVTLSDATRLYEEFMTDPVSPGRLCDRERPQLSKAFAHAGNTLLLAARDAAVGER